MGLPRWVRIMPLTELWTSDGAPVPANRARLLNAAEARELVRSRPDFELVVATAGEHLQWLYGDEKWRFWKEELLPRITDPLEIVFFDDSDPDNYRYEASEWEQLGSDRPILLAEHHER
jgi:hypothetical protein